MRARGSIDSTRRASSLVAVFAMGALLTGTSPIRAESTSTPSRGDGSRVPKVAAETGGTGSSAVPNAPHRAAAGSTEAGAGDPSAVTARAFSIRFRDPGDVALLIGPLLSVKGSVITQPKLRTVTVQDTREILDRVRDLIASYDVPPRSVEFTITLILASRGEEGRQPISREVRGITEALPDITRWTDYKTLDSATIVGSEGSRTLRDLADSYRIEFQLESVSESRNIIRLNPFSLQKLERDDKGTISYRTIASATVNLTNQRLLTIGATKSQTSDRALFLAIKARIQNP